MIEREAKQHELLSPILAQVEDHFVYQGSAREYFLRAIRHEAAYTRPASRLPAIERYYAWHGYLGRRRQGQAQRREHPALAEVARDRRARQRPALAEAAGLPPDHPILDAIESVPRERFVPLESVLDSTRDVAVPLDDSGMATVSAMHAYAIALAQLQVGPGDRVLDLGAGTGYGAALLQAVVGDEGEVIAIELDPDLVERAVAELPAAVRCVAANALDPDCWPPGAASMGKVTVGFALETLPQAWREVLPAGTVVVAPLQHEGTLRLCRVVLRGPDEAPEHTWLHEVSYVPAREQVARRHRGAPPSEASVQREPTRLTVLD